MVLSAPPRSAPARQLAKSAAPPPRRRIKSASRMDAFAPYMYIAPFFALFAVFGLFPTVFTFYVALFDWNPIGGQTFIGFENFVTLYGDERFWNAMRNTFSIWILSTVPQLLLALFLAQLLNNARLKFANLFRMTMLVPYITSVVATTIVFASLFGRDYGLINSFLNLFGIESIDFAANTFASHIMVSTMVLWRWFGYNTLIYLAALQAIPKDIYEAAAIDGAGGFKQFIFVTIPSLRPVIIFTVIVSTIGGLQIFTEPLLLSSPGLTGGAGRQFQTLSLFMYEQGFGDFKFGYGSAVGVTLFALIVVFSVINYLLSRRITSDE
ncbi:sugar ABC transporter permease [Salinibacterium sp. NSLL150]|uniref:carbohydrate ABC transporter permease n=1 Tax=unclassified Salinibacterium TaxID=2632331 RepID=UPI0018CD2722|nr:MULTISPECIES: sugar ABC transporter permease [unclassified Salinibacterium]MBH0099732.1 sugar ABC transporter permease [Salinibacterium sp. NSLL35]MBH0102486.1 sugar ABC transporter permease [Salinibacterium sp. NSLL150]MBH0105246.1 sugar ABC transporter permease [Salinibacterium sp. NSLL16]MBH0108006.1 sugar ABC transporter permease [Salinibacterium sp. NSLL17]MBH0110772.1 sugar ABC transporter permease [Salinibacterium sp. NG22]